MTVVTFGEVMLRLAPEGFTRLSQTLPGPLVATFGGGELNVAVSVAVQGGQARFMTCVPDNPITDCLEREMRKLGVGAELVTRSRTGRFGVYYVETGANQRGGTVTYDREGSSISQQAASFYDWAGAFRDAKWFHITGITPAISRTAADASLAAVKEAKAAGLTVSCDLNFRRKLWRWDSPLSPVDLARRTMQTMMPYIDVVIANEEDADLSLGIGAKRSDIDAGRLDVTGYQEVAERIVERFPNVARVAITLRESLSASHNNWGAMLFDAADRQACFAPTDVDGNYSPYEIRNIVDRVGAGDSFAGALIREFTANDKFDPEHAIRYAVAASCLKHSISGDFNYATRDEILALVHGSGSGRVQR